MVNTTPTITQTPTKKKKGSLNQDHKLDKKDNFQFSIASSPFLNVNLFLCFHVTQTNKEVRASSPSCPFSNFFAMYVMGIILYPKSCLITPTYLRK